MRKIKNCSTCSEYDQSKSICTNSASPNNGKQTEPDDFCDEGDFDEAIHLPDDYDD